MKHCNPSPADRSDTLHHEVTCFSLAPLTVPYAQWDGRTQLYRDGAPTATYIEGCDLRTQYALDTGYLIVTQYDCPYEEAVTLTLLGHDLKVRARTTLPRVFYPVVGLPSYCFDRIVWHTARSFDLHIRDLAHYYRFTIRDSAIPFLYPRLKKRRILHPS